MKEISERKRVRMTGKGGKGKFIALPDSISGSDQFGQLSGIAVKMLIELARQYNGKNNGDFSMAWSRLRRRGWKSKGTVKRAKDELIAGQWIVETRKGGRDHVCSLFAVTWWAIDDCGGKHFHPVENVASNAWKKINSTGPYSYRTGPYSGQSGKKVVNF